MLFSVVLVAVDVLTIPMDGCSFDGIPGGKDKIKVFVGGFGSVFSVENLQGLVVVTGDGDGALCDVVKDANCFHDEHNGVEARNFTSVGVAVWDGSRNFVDARDVMVMVGSFDDVGCCAEAEF